MRYQTELKRQYYNAVTVSLSFLLSIVCYGVAVFLVKTQGSRLLATGRDGILILRAVLLVLTACALFSLGRIRAWIMMDGGMGRTAAAPVPALSRRLFHATVITMAIAEVPALFGLVLFFISLDLRDFYLFAAMAMSAMIIYLPKYDQWERWAASRPPEENGNDF